MKNNENNFLLFSLLHIWIFENIKQIKVKIYFTFVIINKIKRLNCHCLFLIMAPHKPSPLRGMKTF